MDPLTQLSSAQLLEQLSALVCEVEELTEIRHRFDYREAACLAAVSRIASAIAAREQHADHGVMVHRTVEAEVASATRMGQVAAGHRIAHARTLLADYPNVAAALSDGVVSYRHTDVIVTCGQIITTPAARAAYETEVLPLALTLTAYQLRAHAKRLAEHFAERDIDDRYAEAKETRGVRVTDLEDGMADLTATIGAVEAYAIKDRLARIAHHVHTGQLESGAARSESDSGEAAGHSSRKSQRDERTLAQTQADVFTELLLTGTGAVTTSGAGSSNRDTADSGSPGMMGASSPTTSPAAPHPCTGDPASAITGRVQITVPVLALTGKHKRGEGGEHVGPAELAGYGPIPLSTARRLTGHAPAWERVLTHPVSGMVLAVDRYRPGEDLKRFLGARDQHCRFPGCLRRLDHCDIDHTVPAAKGGPTAAENLGHLCRRHHTLKHFEFFNGSGWKPKQKPGGVYGWDSPTGRRYRTTPTSTVRFKPVHASPGRESPPSASHGKSPPGEEEPAPF